jgi:large subunit ribosomal protein L22
MATAVDTGNEVRAEAKWVRVSPRKARLVADHIRGRSVPEARTVLAFTSRAAAREIERVLKSAVANAEANHGLLGDDLVVSAAYVDEGPTLKRWRPRARGRVGRIKKRTCHITIKLAEGEQVAAPRARPAAPPARDAAPVQKRRRARQPEVEPGDVETTAETVEPTAEEPSDSTPSAQPEAADEGGEQPDKEEE